MIRCGKRQNVNSSHKLERLSVAELRRLVEKLDSSSNSSSKFKNISRMTRAELCKAYHSLAASSHKSAMGNSNSNSNSNSNTGAAIGMLRYDGQNSCYVDTTLTALFHLKNKWITRNIIKKRDVHVQKKRVETVFSKMQREIIELYDHIQMNGDDEEGATCSTLRSMFAKFDAAYQKDYGVKLERINWLAAQQEPRDVMDVLTRAYDIKPDVCVSVYRGSNSLSTSSTNMRVHFNAPYISPDILKENKSLKLSSVFPIMKETLPNGKTQITKYTKADFIVVNIGRNWLDEKKLTTPVLPQRKVKLEDESKLELVSIICHHGRQTTSGHYTAFLKHKGTWWLYDDMSSKMKNVGRFAEMVVYDRQCAMRNSVAFVYCKCT